MYGAKSWEGHLKGFVEKKPIVVLKFEGEEWDHLRESRRGVRRFTIARSHQLVEKVRASSICIILGTSADDESACVGVISSKAAVTTLESRLNIGRCVRISPNSQAKLIELISNKGHSSSLRDRLRSKSSVVVLAPKLSVHLVGAIASIDENRGALRNISEYLSDQKGILGMRGMQEDALNIAFNAFGLSGDQFAKSLEIVKGKESALARVSVMEDSVIEHDARVIPGYDLVGSDLTGRAVFEGGGQRLEVFTANRRPLERVFGVDLIYLNSIMQNIVMLQYKMLEPVDGDHGSTDWIYRPDSKLDDEIDRMRVFQTDHSPGKFDYRLNPAVFFLKFVKRDASQGKGSVIMTVDHFEMLRTDPKCRGPKNGLRVSFDSLSGRYLRQTGFLDLIKSGYIGAHATDTAHLKTLVDAVLENGKAVVAAIQKSTEEGG